MAYEYKMIIGGDYPNWDYATCSSIIAQLDPTVPYQLAHINSIRELQDNQCRYSNNAIGKTEVADYAAGWVARMIAYQPKA